MTSQIRLSHHEVKVRLRQRAKLARQAVGYKFLGYESFAEDKWKKVDALDREIAEAAR